MMVMIYYDLFLFSVQSVSVVKILNNAPTSNKIDFLAVEREASLTAFPSSGIFLWVKFNHKEHKEKTVYYRNALLLKRAQRLPAPDYRLPTQTGVIIDFTHFSFPICGKTFVAI